MSNIHGLGDYRRNQGNPRLPLNSNMGGVFPFGSTQKDPRKEDIFDMFKFACCPRLDWKTFTAIIAIVDVFMFTAVLVVGGIQPGKRISKSKIFDTNDLRK